MTLSQTSPVTWALADRLRGTPVTANALKPGYVLTELSTNVGAACGDFTPVG